MHNVVVVLQSGGLYNSLIISKQTSAFTRHKVPTLYKLITCMHTRIK